MDLEAVKVKALEFIGSFDAFEKARQEDSARKGGLEAIDNFLGRELKREETRGKKVVRCFENKEGQVVLFRIFDETGAFKGEYACYSDDKIEAVEKEVESESDPGYIETVEEIELFNLRHHYRNLVKDVTTFKLTDGSHQTFYLKVPNHSLDIYMNDPFCVHCPDSFSPERSLYVLGYKKSGDIVLDPDGIVWCHTRRHFDEKGLLLRGDFYQGTPWGEEVLTESSIWKYDPKNFIVTRENVVTATGVIREMDRYLLDWMNQISERKVYWKDVINLPQPVIDTHTTDGMSIVFKRNYGYDKNRRLREIRSVNFRNPGSSNLVYYKYDAAGRLIAEKEYGINDELSFSLENKYLPGCWVRQTCRYYPGSFVYQVLKGNKED